MTRRVAFVIFPGFQLLDATGPIATFEIGGRYRPGSYVLEMIGPTAGPIRSTSGAAVCTDGLVEGPFDTIVVAGGEGSRAYADDAPLIQWLRRESSRARRVTSVCTGVYLLAQAGLMAGKRATTHWSASEHFVKCYPGVRLEPDRIFIRDGEIWTSAGITAGIDLALALVEDDLGAKVARRVAQQLVVHHRRAGGQSQFSALLDTGGVHGRFAELMDWIRDRLAEPLSVERLADEAAMSPRHFARAFRAETGLTPAKAVERLRLEAARVRVESTGEPIDRVAETVGFGDPERMRRAFLRAFGQPPQALRRAARA